MDGQRLYEFEIPNTLVGLIIGIGGKTIKELCYRADVKMLIRDHHNIYKQATHQICMVEGKRENINKCLHMIKGRFPRERFPDLNLTPMLPISSHPATMIPSSPVSPAQFSMSMPTYFPTPGGHFVMRYPPLMPMQHSPELLSQYHMFNTCGQTSSLQNLAKSSNDK
ncbi:KH domain-containing protein [Ditylenchus destructor]|uniref:KH domain-containing protein n=1 Tax=Ditylenchus destructor TaxID=166010 RepID=A0AAD4R4N3_9BILA|nr:KH domain-containing protein [Ditylenchus destructor]KAI1715581.1 KH domain-containing protein [Ditylenchus destructor]